MNPHRNIPVSSSKLPYSADLYCSLWSLYLSAVFHNKSTMKIWKKCSRAISYIGPHPRLAIHLGQRPALHCSCPSLFAPFCPFCSLVMSASLSVGNRLHPIISPLLINHNLLLWMSSTYKPINVTNSSIPLFFCLFFCVKDGQVSQHTSVLVIGKRVMMDQKEQHCHCTNKVRPLFPPASWP